MGGGFRYESCTRWEELSITAVHHAELASVMPSRMTFRVLNDPGSVAAEGRDLSVGDSSSINAVDHLKEALHRSRPTGTSNITKHLTEMHPTVVSMAKKLANDNGGSSVASSSKAKKHLIGLLVCTDGRPTEENSLASQKRARSEFAKAIDLFRDLPVRITVRLSSDCRDAIGFFCHEDMTAALDECSIGGQVEVLRSYAGEARDVQRHNPWMTYGLPLHRFRESCVRVEAIDRLSERPFSPREVKKLYQILFEDDFIDEEGGNNVGGSARRLPDPIFDWDGFFSRVSRTVKDGPRVWHPLKEKPTPWMDCDLLDKIYGDAARRGLRKANGGCRCTIL